MKGEEKRGLSMSDEQAEPCESASVSSGLALSIAIVLVASFTPSYSPQLTCHVLLAIVLAAGTLIDIILTVSYLLSFSPPAPSFTSYSSCCIVQLPAVCHSES